MRHPGGFEWPDMVQRLRLGALLAMVVLLLASCTGGSVLTDSAPSEPRGKTVPPVSIQQVTGVPPGRLAELKSALAVSGGERDIGFIEGALQSGSFSLEGQFKAFADASGVRIIYQWWLRDADGVLVQTIDGEDNAGLPAGNDPWTAVSAAVIDRIARRTTESLAQKLSQLGYATRLSKLYVPPAEYFAMASPDAHREVDFETLNGPGMALAGMDMIAPPEDPALAAGGLDPIPNEAQLAMTTPAPPEPEPEAEPPAVAAVDKTPADKKASGAKTKGGMDIRAVAVMPVRGSPLSAGDAELTAAMRETLSAAGWPVVSKPGPNALTIVGRVKVAKGEGPEQAVSVRWEVQSPDGKMLGDVKQANNVPRGALDRGWGPAAFAVAEAGATGIFDIVKRLR